LKLEFQAVAGRPIVNGIEVAPLVPPAPGYQARPQLDTTSVR
jgi:hypothetical protein